MPGWGKCRDYGFIRLKTRDPWPTSGKEGREMVVVRTKEEIMSKMRWEDSLWFSQILGGGRSGRRKNSKEETIHANPRGEKINEKKGTGERWGWNYEHKQDNEGLWDFTGEATEGIQAPSGKITVERSFQLQRGEWNIKGIKRGRKISEEDIILWSRERLLWPKLGCGSTDGKQILEVGSIGCFLIGYRWLVKERSPGWS